MELSRSGMGDAMSDDGPILVVDDDPALRRALSRILRTEGHAVIEAPDGPTAVALTREHMPSLVVLDAAMPGMDGEMVLEAFRDHVGAVPPTVLLTGSRNEQARATEVGAVLGLCKPFQVEELLGVVDRYRRARKPDA
ncbi:MAG: response regulator [Polyangiales bacterium]